MDCIFRSSNRLPSIPGSLHFTALKEYNPVLFPIPACILFGQSLPGRLIQHLTDRDRRRNTRHLCKRNRKFGLASALI